MVQDALIRSQILGTSYHRLYFTMHYSINFSRDQEPEFIEWGFGGMGSVSSGGSSMCSKVQSGAGVSVGACDEKWGGSTGSGTSSGGSGQGTDDLDDGSGMAWVRRRREKREQERREREEMERLKREKGLTEMEITERGDVEEITAEDAGETMSPVVVTSPVDLDADGLAKVVKDVKEGEEHITEAVTVPAPSHRHPHHSHSSYHRPSNSLDRSSTIRKAPERRESTDTARGVPPPVGANDETVTPLPVAHEKSSSADSGSADGETDEIVTSPDASANATEDELSSDSDSEEDEVCRHLSFVSILVFTPFLYSRSRRDQPPWVPVSRRSVAIN